MSAGRIRIWLSLATFLAIWPVGANETPADAPTPAVALQWLEEGNVRFQAGAPEGPRRDEARRAETSSKGQHPYAAILSCADSRVAPEILFDAGIGDLFVVRVAGNVADTDEIGTLEYGVEHLHTPLIVVVGHGKCGAVTAVVDNAHVPPNIAKLVDNIAPAVESTKKRFASLKGPALIQQSIRMNVRQSMSDLLTKSEIIRQAVAQGEIKLIGAVYDLNSGSIEWMGAHPDESALIAKSGDATASIDEHGGELVKPKPAHDAKPATHDKQDPHAQPAAKDPHGKPAADSHDKPAAHDSHGSHDASHESHGEAHPATQPAEQHGKLPAPHNFIALGSCLAGGAVMSMLTIHLMKPKKAAQQPVK